MSDKETNVTNSGEVELNEEELDQVAGGYDGKVDDIVSKDKVVTRTGSTAEKEGFFDGWPAKWKLDK